MPKNYLAMVSPKPEDKQDHGIRGMKWGVRRTDSQIKAGIAKMKAKGEPVTPTKKAASVKPSSSLIKPPDDGAESSVARYARIQAIAKSGQADSLPDSDLKFFNARTEALSKVAKLNEQKPGWLAQTTKSVLQNAAQRQLQQVANAAADKTISRPIIERLNPVDNEKK